MNEQTEQNRPQVYPDWVNSFRGRAPLDTVYFIGGNRIESYVVYPADEYFPSLEGCDFVDLLFDKYGNCFGWSYNAAEGSLHPSYSYT